MNKRFFWRVPTLAIAALLSASAMAEASATAAGAPDEELRPWTFLVYGAADNNADGPILSFLHDVRQSWDDDPGIELLLWLDRSEGFSDDAEALGEDFTGARLYRLRANSAERLEGGELFPEMKLDEEYEADSGDARNLGKFITWAKHHYPARRFGLMIYSHADGTAMCPDEKTRSEMGIAELSDVLGEDQSVDFLALELCNMGGAEIAYQWRPGNGGFYADVLVAIPNAGPPLDWGRAFARVRTPAADGSLPEGCLDPAKLDAEAFGRLIVEEGGKGRTKMAKDHPEHAEQMKYESVAAYDLYAAEDVKIAVDELAIALVDTEGREAFEALRGPGHACCTMNYVGNELTRLPYVDLYDLCRRAAACEELDDAVRAAAESVLEATDAMVLASFGMPGHEDFIPGQNGVFIVFPDGEEGNQKTVPGRGTAWRQLGWYTPHRVEDGPWVWGHWAWCADGATEDNGEVENWFEMLDHWYDVDNAAGGANRYRK